MMFFEILYVLLALFCLNCFIYLTNAGRSRNTLLDNANYQCRNLYGPDASFCQSSLSTMCSALSCRLNSTSVDCIQADFGATNGTQCGAKKICLNGVCVDVDEENKTIGNSRSKSIDNDCPFGESVIPSRITFADPQLQILVPEQMSCENFMKFLLVEKSLSPFKYCQDSAVRQFCCQTCKLVDGMNCEDKNSSDPSCMPAGIKCSHGLCLNNAACVNDTPSTENNNPLFGFSCQCSAGYSGRFCELKNPCEPNPCMNSGICSRLNAAAVDFKCACPTGFSGKTCQENSSLITSASVPRNLHQGGGFFGPCSPSFCSNVGQCTNFNTNYYCPCPYTYYGGCCEYRNACLYSNPCLNGGTCYASTNWPYFYSCSCPLNYRGSNCQYYTKSSDIDVNYCAFLYAKGLCFMYSKTLCPVTCDGDYNGVSSCVDLLNGCNLIYCAYIASYTPHPCRKTCGLC